jgi:hypothetical protein
MRVGWALFLTLALSNYSLLPCCFFFAFVQENAHLDPNDEDTKKKINVAYKGLQQLGMYDQQTLGGKQNPNWSVTLEQNPMPKPSHL